MKTADVSIDGFRFLPGVSRSSRIFPGFLSSFRSFLSGRGDVARVVVFLKPSSTAFQIVCHNLRTAEPLRALYERLRSAAPNSPIVLTIDSLALRAVPARFLDGISTHILHLNTSNVVEFDDAAFEGFETKVLDMKTNTPVAPPLRAVKTIPKLGTLLLHGYKVEGR